MDDWLMKERVKKYPISPLKARRVYYGVGGSGRWISISRRDRTIAIIVGREER